MSTQLSQKMTPCLWFDSDAEEAPKFYTSIFKNSKITQIARYGEVGQEIHGRKRGSVMRVAFELHGHTLTALNGGPYFKFNEAISLQVNCNTQEQLDYFWEKLGADAIQMRSSAAGSRISTACRGGSCRRICRSCWRIRTRRKPIA